MIDYAKLEQLSLEMLFYMIAYVAVAGAIVVFLMMLPMPASINKRALLANVIRFAIPVCVIVLGTATIAIMHKTHLRVEEIPTIAADPQPSALDDKIHAAAMCIAEVIYHEGRGEIRAGRLAIASVVMNRAGGKSESACDAAAEAKQFMGYDNKAWRKNLTDTPEWIDAYDMAMLVLTRSVPDLSESATHYHSVKIQRPVWARAKTMRHTVTIGNHRFYRGR